VSDKISTWISMSASPEHQQSEASAINNQAESLIIVA
jgi:hypothetical protein